MKLLATSSLPGMTGIVPIIDEDEWISRQRFKAGRSSEGDASVLLLENLQCGHWQAYRKLHHAFTIMIVVFSSTNGQDPTERGALFRSHGRWSIANAIDDHGLLVELVSYNKTILHRTATLCWEVLKCVNNKAGWIPSGNGPQKNRTAGDESVAFVCLCGRCCWKEL